MHPLTYQAPEPFDCIALGLIPQATLDTNDPADISCCDTEDGPPEPQLICLADVQPGNGCEAKQREWAYRQGFLSAIRPPDDDDWGETPNPMEERHVARAHGDWVLTSYYRGSCHGEEKRVYVWNQFTSWPENEVEEKIITPWHADCKAWADSGNLNFAVPPAPPTIDVDPLDVPGFVNQVAAYTLATSPYQNRPLAVAGALALLSALTGRKVCDEGNLRTNVYIFCLAGSGVGKDRGRQVNKEISLLAGAGSMLGERAASGQGLEDALARHPVRLLQSDEIDSIFREAKSCDGRHEALISSLLTLFSTSESVHPTRLKAGQDEPGVIYQPHLSILGSATPENFYQSLNERNLSGGLLARCIVFEADKRGRGVDFRHADVPREIIDVARWWMKFTPGAGDLAGSVPQPRIVQYTESASEPMAKNREADDDAYARAEERRDHGSMAIWARCNELTRKLALLFACSACHEDPVVDHRAVAWANKVVRQQIDRTLKQVDMNVANDLDEAKRLAILRRLDEAPGKTLSRSKLLKRVKMQVREFDMHIDTLVQRRDISYEIRPSAGGRPAGYFKILLSPE